MFLKIFTLSMLFITALLNLKAQDTVTEKVDAIFNEYYDYDGPGCAVAIVLDNKIVYKNAFGIANLEHQIPITAHTVFELASIAKQFTGYGIAILIDEGKIKLQDNIRKYIPELPDYEATVTINHLLHHISGIQDQYALLAYSGYRDGDLMKTTDMMNVILNQDDLDFLPGEHYTYSNSNYRLLAEIITRVSKQSFPEFMEEYIFKPLNMGNTQFVDDYDKIIPNSASPYKSTENGSYAKAIFSTATIGSSGLWSTVEDMTKWIMNFNNPTAGNKNVLKLIQQKGMLNDGRIINYGFGLELEGFEGQKRIYHDGVGVGYMNMLHYYPEQDLGIVILSNNDDTVFDLATQVASIYLSELTSENEPINETVDDSSNNQKISKPKSPYKINIADLKPYLYSFELSNGTIITFKIKDNKFFRCIDGRPDAELVPESNTRFYYKNRAFLEINFTAPENGPLNTFDLIARGVKVEKGTRIITENPQELRKYIGVYEHDKLNIKVSISIEKNQLIIKHFKFGSSPLQFSSKKGLFYGTNFWLNRLEFIYDKSRNIQALKILNPPIDRFNGVRLNKITNN